MPSCRVSIFHVMAKPFRISTKVTYVTTLVHGIHVVALLADDIPELSHWVVTDNTNKTLLIEYARHKDWISKRHHHGCASIIPGIAQRFLSVLFHNPVLHIETEGRVDLSATLTIAFSSGQTQLLRILSRILAGNSCHSYKSVRV